MALTAWLATGFLFEEICENFYSSRKHEGQRALWRLGAWFLLLFAFWWFSETNAAIGEIELGDFIDFAIIAVPLTFVVAMAILIIRRGWAVSSFVDPKVLRKTK